MRFVALIVMIMCTGYACSSAEANKKNFRGAGELVRDRNQARKDAANPPPPEFPQP